MRDLNSIAARTGAAAAAVIDLLHAPGHGRTDANGPLSMQSRAELAALARVTVAAAWASDVDTRAGDDDNALESSDSSLSAAATFALGMVLASDAAAVAAAAVMLADPRREAMPPAAYPVALTAFACLPDAAHVVLARRVGLDVIAAVIGRAVQVDPIKHMSKGPGIKRLKLKYDKLLSNLLKFCFQCPTCDATHWPGSGGSSGGGDTVRRV
jgi:hypothetical protein